MRNGNTIADKVNEHAPAVPKLAFTVNEAATALGVAPITIYRMLARGIIRASNACRHKIIPATEIYRFLEESIK